MQGPQDLWDLGVQMHTPDQPSPSSSHYTRKFGLIFNLFYDLISRDVYLSTVIYLRRKRLRKGVIEANL